MPGDFIPAGPYVPAGSGSGTSDHTLLTNRNAAGQHNGGSVTSTVQLPGEGASSTRTLNATVNAVAQLTALLKRERDITEAYTVVPGDGTINAYQTDGDWEITFGTPDSYGSGALFIVSNRGEESVNVSGEPDMFGPHGLSVSPSSYTVGAGETVIIKTFNDEESGFHVIMDSAMLGGSTDLRSATQWRPFTMVADGTTVTNLEFDDDGYAIFNRFIVPISPTVEPPAAQLRASLFLGWPEDGVPDQDIDLSAEVYRDEEWVDDPNAAALGPSVFQPRPTPSYLFDIMTAFSTLTNFDFTGGNSQDITLSVNGTQETRTLDTDVGDSSGFFGWLVGFFGDLGATFQSSWVDPVTGAEIGLAFTAPSVRDNEISIIDPGTGEVADAFALLQSSTANFYYIGPALMNIGNGEFGIPVSSMHAWTDGNQNRQHKNGGVTNTVVNGFACWVWTRRKMRPEELDYTVKRVYDWNTVPTNVAVGIDELAARGRHQRTVSEDIVPYDSGGSEDQSVLLLSDEVLGVDTTAGIRSVDLFDLTQLGRSLCIDNILGINIVTLVGEVAGQTNPTIAPGDSVTIFVGTEGLRFH